MLKSIRLVLLVILAGGLNVFAQTGKEKSPRDQPKSPAGKRVEVRVDGLSCPFCAYGLEKKFMEIDGIEDLKIDFKKGVVGFFVADEKAIDEKTIKKIVKDAGFTVREIFRNDQ